MQLLYGQQRKTEHQVHMSDMSIMTSLLREQCSKLHYSKMLLLHKLNIIYANVVVKLLYCTFNTPTVRTGLKGT